MRSFNTKKGVSVIALSLILFNLIAQIAPVKVQAAIDAPSVYLDAVAPVSEGTSISFHGYFHDIMLDPTGYYWTAQIDFGNGDGYDFGEVSPSQSLDYTYNYGYVSGTTDYSVRLNVVRHNPKIGIAPVGTASTVATILNVVPNVTITPRDQVVTEGTIVTLSAYVEGGNAPLSYAWSGACSGYGVYSDAPSTVGTHTCSVTVTDVDGDSDTDSTTVKVNAKLTNPTQPPVTEPPADNDNDDDDVVVEPVVMGSQTCSAKSIVSGYVYFDNNGNGTRESQENGAENVELKVYFNQNGQLELVIKITTDDSGYWKTNLCGGNYTVRLSEDTLPENTQITGAGELDFAMEAGINTEDINFGITTVTTDATSNFNWLWVIIPLIVALLGITVYAAAKSRKEMSIKK